MLSTVSLSFVYHILTPLLLFTQFDRVQSVLIFTKDSLPSNLTIGCGDALTKDVACSAVVKSLQDGLYYPQKDLEDTCTSTCNEALGAYEAAVKSSCAGEVWNGYFNETLPILMIPDLLRYEFNQTCLMDSGRYCNVVAAKAAGVDGQQVPIDAGDDHEDKSTDCDLCSIKKLQFIAGSPYFDGPRLASLSIYESKTSSCSVTGYPLKTSTLDFFTPTTTSAPTPSACVGKSYNIKPDDTCQSISKSQNIGTTWLLLDNNLEAFCGDFPKNGTLCLVNTCDVYTVKPQDTCDSISKASNITSTQLLAWNPNINVGCNNLNKTVGYQICISQPGKKYVPPSAAFAAPTSVTVAAPAPTDLAKGTNEKCGLFYKVALGDFCNLLVVKFSISMADFTFLNPEINTNCTNLLVDESYCVQPVGDINTYPGRAGFASATAVPLSTVVFSSFADATFVPTPKNKTDALLLPLATKTRTDCETYVSGKDLQQDWADGFFTSSCSAVASIFGISLDDLGNWNPSLGDTSLPTCAFNPTNRYCAQWSASTGHTPPDEPDNSALPIRDGASPKCTAYYSVYNRDTCQNVLKTNDLTIKQFFEYNPAVKADCSGLWPNYQYCVRTPDFKNENPPSNGNSASPTPAQSSSSSKASSPTSTPPRPTGTNAAAAPSPTQENSISPKCNKYAKSEKGDFCFSFAQKNGISPADLYAWNTVLGDQGSACDTRFWLDYYYCVGVDS